MKVRLYNSLTRKKDVLSPINGNEVSIYTCGPTVYNYAHIGNLRTYIFEDILVRALIFAGYKTKRVMNITDVGHLVSDADEGEDKMELALKRENKTSEELADFYTKAFFADFAELNCLLPDIQCKATGHINDMLELVKVLEQKGFAYKISDGIYFDTSKFPEYHKLAGKENIEGIKKGARVEFNEEKRNPADFALWKFSPKNKKRQMEWPSPWGVGFPGWHIECSAMAMKYLGATMDIHCGGEDHVGVHHTNEIAQSECATGKPFSNLWMHGKFLVLKDDAKMSKSTGNFLTLSSLKEKGYSPLAYRYLCLTAHYLTPLEFSFASMDFAQKSFDSLKGICEGILGKISGAEILPAAQYPRLSRLCGDFSQAVLDDLNMPKALAVVWIALKDADLNDSEKISFASYADEVLGLGLGETPKEEIIDEECRSLIKEREAARANKNFARSDELRKILLQKGISVLDTHGGTKWKRLK